LFQNVYDSLFSDYVTEGFSRLTNSLSIECKARRFLLQAVLCGIVLEDDKVEPKQERQCTYTRNIETRSRNHCCCWKARSVTYSEFVSVSLVIQHAKRIRRIILSPVACLALPYFHTHLINEKKCMKHTKCVLIFSTNVVW